MKKTPLLKLTEKRDRAMRRFQKLEKKTELARERWVRLSAEVSALDTPAPETAATPTSGPTENALPHITVDHYRQTLSRGLYTRVAKTLNLGKSGRTHVSRVAAGQRRSPRVEAALLAEQQDIDRMVAEYRETIDGLFSGASAKERAA